MVQNRNLSKDLLIFRRVQMRWSGYMKCIRWMFLCYWQKMKSMFFLINFTNHCIYVSYIYTIDNCMYNHVSLSWRYVFLFQFNLQHSHEISNILYSSLTEILEHHLRLVLLLALLTTFKIVIIWSFIKLPWYICVL